MAMNFKISSNPVAAVAIAVTVFMFPVGARAAADNRVAATYVVEIGRLPVLKMKYNAILAGNNYQSTAEVEANGFGGLFSDYRMDMAAMGSVSGRNTSPAHF